MSHYKDLLERAFSEVFGFTVTLEVISEENKPVKPIENITESFTFDNFIVGPSNDFAHAAAVAVAKIPVSNTIPFLFTENRALARHIF